MKILNCPINGPRNISEFQYFGPVREEAPETAATIVARNFHAANPAGPLVEWWRHTPSNTVFLAERDTVTDEILRTWLPGADAGERE